MKPIKNLIISMGIFSIFITGCLSVRENEEQPINVQKRIGEENKYENLKEITNHNQVQKVKEILDNIDWQYGKFDRGNLSDYRFFFQSKNPNSKAAAVLYELWISPDRKMMELVIDAESKFVQLDKNKSAELYEILTAAKLSDIK